MTKILQLQCRPTYRGQVKGPKKGKQLSTRDGSRQRGQTGETRGRNQQPNKTISLFARAEAQKLSQTKPSQAFCRGRILRSILCPRSGSGTAGCVLVIWDRAIQTALIPVYWRIFMLQYRRSKLMHQSRFSPAQKEDRCILHRPIQVAMAGQPRQQPGIAVGLIAHSASLILTC